VGLASTWAEPEGLEGGSLAEGLQEGSTMALYCSVIELVLMLATDTAPRVAALGKRVLLLAGLDLAPTQSMWSVPRTSAAAPVPAGGSYQGGGLSPGSTSSSRGLGEQQSLGGSCSGGLVGGPGGGSISTSSSVPLAGGIGSSSAPVGGGSGSSVSVGASLGSLTSKLVKGAGRNWRSGFTSSGAAGGGAAARTTPPSISSTPSSSSSPPSPSREGYAVVGYSRPPYVLRAASILQDMGGGGSSSSNIHGSYTHQQQQQVQYGSSVGDLADGTSRSLGQMASSSSGSLAGGAGFAGEELNPGVAGAVGGGLPPSHCYRLSCEYFSRPMLDPQATAWRELEAPKLAPWISPPDIHRKTQRLREMDAARQRCHNVNNPKIREQVGTRGGERAAWRALKKQLLEFVSACLFLGIVVLWLGGRFTYTACGETIVRYHVLPELSAAVLGVCVCSLIHLCTGKPTGSRAVPQSTTRGGKSTATTQPDKKHNHPTTLAQIAHDGN
jgi:hypothetical protein